MQKTKKKNITQVSEPETVYSISHLRQNEGTEIIISSLEEQEEANYFYWLSLSPLQRLELHYKMITTFYKDALMKKRKNNQKIIFSI